MKSILDVLWLLLVLCLIAGPIMYFNGVLKRRADPEKTHWNYVKKLSIRSFWLLSSFSLTAFLLMPQFHSIKGFLLVVGGCMIIFSVNTVCSLAGYLSPPRWFKRQK